MNILFLNSARAWGGNEKWTKMASESLSKEHKVYFAYRKEVIGKMFKVKKIKLPFFSELDIFSIFKLISFILINKIEILIPTKKKDYFLAGIACRLTGRKNVLRLGIVREMGNSIFNKLIYKTLADGIIVNAKQIEETLLKTDYMRSQKIAVIYNGVEPILIDKTKYEEKTQNKFQIISVGSLIKRKKMDLVILAFAQFVNQTKIANTELLIVGEGVELENLKEIAKQNRIGEMVKFPGFVNNPFNQFKNSDVFILCSENEGISNAILEAMFLGKVVISTVAGGIDYALENGKNGFVVDENPKQIADILEKVYFNEELRHQLGSESKVTIAEKFSIERMQTNIANFLSKVIENKAV